ncbi:MAG: type II CAAX endopeptidase family protein [Gemmatimonadetes bacterium]|nr:type II CAAX endopeptidase family protein [Gemmatimonadota bacterium]
MTGTALRTEAGVLRAPWRLAVFGAAVVASSIVIGVIGFSLASLTSVSAMSRAARLPLDQLLSAISIVVATWATGRMVAGEDFAIWRYVGVGAGHWSPRVISLATGAGAATIALPALVLVGIGAAQFDPSVSTDSAWAVAWAAFALMMPAAIVEELLFRGYAFTVCVEAIGSRGAIVVTSVLFALAHVFNPDPTVASVTAVACAGVFLAVVRVTTGSLVAAVAAHFWINYTQAVALHAPVSGLALQMPGYRFVEAGPDWLTGGAWGPEAGAGAVLTFAVASFLYLRRFTKRSNSTSAANSGVTPPPTP